MKRIVSLAMAVVLLSSCTLKSDSDRFKEYTDSYFQAALMSNGITFNYTLRNPENYGITVYPTTLGRYSVPDEEIENTDDKTVLDELAEYDYEKLTEEQKILYNLIKYRYELSLEAEGLEYYSEPLKAYSGTHTLLPTLFSEFRIDDMNDAEQYLSLVADIPLYFDSIIAFEQKKSENGLFMSDDNVDVVISDCENAIKNIGIMYTSFEDRINNSDFTEEEKSDLIARNKAVVDEVFESSYKKLITELKKLKGTGTHYDSISELPEGKRYYEYLVKSSTGTEYSVDEIIEMLDEDIEKYRQDFFAIATEHPDEYRSENYGMEYAVSDPYEVMDYLYTNMGKDYPVVPDYSANIKYTDGKSSTAPAYYIKAPIDSADEAVIYINQERYGSDTYNVVAHEGTPGHMYQNLYFSGVCNEPLRYLFSFDGYTEGWAAYVERESYYYAGENSDAAVGLTVSNSMYTLALITRTDIGVNYEGWTIDECDDFYEKYNLTPATSEYYYNIVRKSPANYLSYYLGYRKITDMRAWAEEELRSYFNLRDFHKVILDAGPVPLEFLDEIVGEYIETTLAEHKREN